MKTPGIALLTALHLFSCAEHTVIEKDGIIFQMDKELNESTLDWLSDGFAKSLNELDFAELRSIKTIRIDSVPFGYFAAIPYDDSVTEKASNRAESLAAIVSKYELENAPVHITLTDNDFNTRKLLPFNPNAIKSIGISVRSSGLSIESTYNCPECSLNGLSMVLSEKVPSLFGHTDTLKIKINNQTSLEVDIYIDIAASDLEKIKSEFSKMDDLYFLATFGRGNIIFRIRDMATGELHTVITFLVNMN